MTRMTTTLLLAVLIAACGGTQDETGGTMSGGTGMKVDSAQMERSMDSETREDDTMDESSMDDAMGDESSMSRDTSATGRP